MKLFSSIFGSRHEDSFFYEYFTRGNSPVRLGKIYIFSSLVFASIFCFLVAGTDLPEVYFEISFVSVFALPAISLISIILRNTKMNIVYLLLVYFLAVTYYAFRDLVYYEFNAVHFFAFFVLFGICVMAMQMVSTRLIYILATIGMLVYGYLFVDDPDVSFSISFGLLFLFSAVAIVVIISRANLINRVQDYTSYLKTVVNNPGIGFILFRSVEQEISILDFNEESASLFRAGDPSEMEKAFKALFGKNDILQINLLSERQSFTKQIELRRDDEVYTVELNIIPITLKNGVFRVASILDISDRILEQQQIARREKKYRNLYNKNLAGVFTVDPGFRLLDFNDTFLEMFNGEFMRGAAFVLYPDADHWQAEVHQVIEKQQGRNFHVKYKLHSGAVKWFNFNWFVDKASGNLEGTVIDLTETYKVTEALRQSETKFRQIYTESNDCILLLNGDRIMDINKTGIQLFGIGKRDMLNYELWELSEDLSEESKREYLKYKNRLNLTKNIKFNWNFVGSGQLIEAEVSFVEIEIDNEIFVQCVLRDLTERNRNQRALEQSRKNLESILENTPESILIIDSKLQLLYCNPRAYRMIGAEEGAHIDFRDLFFGMDQHVFETMLSEHISTRKIIEKQLHLKNASNKLLEVEITLVQTKFADRDAILVIMKDVSVQNRLSKEMMRAELAEETNKRLNKEIRERIRAERDSQEQYLRTKAIFESSSNTLLLTLDRNLNVVTFNSHCAEYFREKIDHKLKRGVNLIDFFADVYAPEKLRLFRRILRQIPGGSYRQLELKIEHDKHAYWMDLFLNPIFDIEGNVSEISLVAHDITDKKVSENELVESLKEKEILLKEIHHRVKNNLQIISSILNLQSSFIQDRKILDILQESRNRIRSMAIIHENLYHTANFSSINFSNYLSNLSINLVSSYQIQENSVNLKTDFEPVELVLDQAIPCGLIVNELVTNALKYAFSGNDEAEIRISLKQEGEQVFISVKDNGVGLPKNFDYEQTDSLGLQLVVTLIEQLDGKLEMISDGGTEFRIVFEKQKI